MAHDTDVARAAALDFLKKHTAGVLASVSRDYKPHASVVYYVADDNFNIYFFTKRNSRKFDAISAHPQVAFTIGRLDVPQTLQIEGVASELRGEEDKAAHIADLMKKLAETNQLYVPIAKMESEVVLMWLEPKWIRWGDFSVPGIRNENLFTEIPMN
jgi:nitroimidazol reductase NimA-like FMN-containing flavoprotein (pyridoxamine 5'-phosphate oxidase superfamily)